MSILICGGGGPYRRNKLVCPTCQVITRFVIHWDGAWYGETFRCCECGDVWQDGMRLRRPFARYWKRDAIAEHERIWRDECVSARKYEQHANADMRAATT